MGDHGRPIEFGFFPVPEIAKYREVIASVELADRLGLDLVGIQDHPYAGRQLDTWTLLSVLAGRTSRIRLFPDVANLPLRYPPLLAKSAATLDLLSGGRFELGLGAGAMPEAVAALGGPLGGARAGGADAVAALAEAVEVIRLMWSGQRSLRYEGRFYTLRGARPAPAPAHDIGIWLGAYRPRMLALVGTAADGWLPSSSYLPPDRLAEAQARIDDAAAAAGRSPAAI